MSGNERDEHDELDDNASPTAPFSVQTEPDATPASPALPPASPLPASPSRPPPRPPAMATPPPSTGEGFRAKSLDAGFAAASELFAGTKKARDVVDDAEERWLVRIRGADYGPFDGPAVRARLEADEIDEHSLVTDTRTGELSDLIDAPHFADFVFDYIPKREKRRRDIEQRKQDLVEEVKMRSVRATFSVALGAIVLAFVGLAGLHLSGVLPFSDVIETVRPTPVEFPFDQVVRNYRFRFEVPEPEYQAIAADQALIASLFAAPSSGGSRSGRSSRGGGGGGRERFDDAGTEDYVLDFDSTKPASKLSSSEVSATLSTHAGRISGCFQDELRNDPSFRGATLRFSINPNGQTFSVRASSDGRMSSTAETCLVRAVRGIRFPTFNDVPMSVSYPFYVK